LTAALDDINKGFGALSRVQVLTKLASPVFSEPGFKF
jgi:hypothetical protein